MEIKIKNFSSYIKLSRVLTLLSTYDATSYNFMFNLVMLDFNSMKLVKTLSPYTVTVKI